MSNPILFLVIYPILKIRNNPNISKYNPNTKEADGPLCLTQIL